MKKSSNAYAVIGLGFGDEGKGVTVNSLCRKIMGQQFAAMPLVVRYSGGQQAGHTVTLEDGKSHVFSNFGSGTLAGVPTYWSRYCTLDPVGIANEVKALNGKVNTVRLYIDKRCPITTPYDKFHNQNSEAVIHGTCGAGVGATYRREEALQSLLAGDIGYPYIFETKLRAIKEYYKNKADISYFLECVEFLRRSHIFQFVNDVPQNYSDIIFEGSQGLLLDQNIGFFPHVTPSNVGTKNILEMGYEPRLFLVTRAFQTRHGNGPMTNLHLPNNIKYNPNETNILNKYQGEFKRSLLDLDLLVYGIERDPYIRNQWDKELVITCLDLVEDEYRYTANGRIISHSNEDEFVEGIAEYLNISFVHRVRSPSGLINPGMVTRSTGGGLLVNG